MTSSLASASFSCASSKAPFTALAAASKALIGKSDQQVEEINFCSLRQS